MVTEEMVYWITRLDEVKEVLRVLNLLFVIFGITSVGFTLFIGLIRDDDPWRFPRGVAMGSILLVLGVLFAIGNAFVPTTKEYAAIKVIPMVANNEDIKELGSEIPKLAREWVDELRPKGEKK